VLEKRELVFGVINGLKHMLKKITTDGELNSCHDKTEIATFDIADIQFPKIVLLCSRLSLLVEKKLTYVTS
jgi:hypothetical protein